MPSPPVTKMLQLHRVHNSTEYDYKAWQFYDSIHTGLYQYLLCLQFDEPYPEKRQRWPCQLHAVHGAVERNHQARGSDWCVHTDTTRQRGGRGKTQCRSTRYVSNKTFPKGVIFINIISGIKQPMFLTPQVVKCYMEKHVSCVIMITCMILLPPCFYGEVILLT